MLLHSHLLLAVLWIAFCGLHSLLAANGTKQVIIDRSKKAGRYYRLFYTVFAAASFAAVLGYQLSMSSPLLFRPHAWMFMTGVMAGLCGLFIMGICIRRYFFRLSGLRGLLQNDHSQLLLEDGLHRYSRHPLYMGTFIFIWALFLLYPRLSLGISNCIITAYTIAGARLEEKKLLRQFGSAYACYRNRVPMFFPGLRKPA